MNPVVSRILNSKGFPSSVGLLLRLEIGIPFALLNWPVSLIVGLVFVIINSFVESKYFTQTKLKSQAYTLVSTCLLNAFAFLIGFACSYRFIYIDEGTRLVDYDKIEGGLILSFGILVFTIIFRITFLLIERYLLPLMERG